MKVYNKMKWALGILLVFIIVLITNLRLESEYMDSKFRDKSELLSLISDIKDDLYDLSKVQLKEGKRQMSLSEKTMDTIELFTQVEIIFLIVMAVLIQLIVLYQPKDKKQSQAQE
jgi:hypothetical protein